MWCAPSPCLNRVCLVPLRLGMARLSFRLHNLAKRCGARPRMPGAGLPVSQVLGMRVRECSSC